MFTTGIVIFLATALILVKLPRRWLLRLLNHSLAIDLGVSAIVLFIHFGTFTGLAAATFAGLLTSLATSGAKKVFGHIANGQYHPGLIYVDVKARP